MPHSLQHILSTFSPNDYQYGFIPLPENMQPISSHERHDFLSADECRYLIDFASGSNLWSESSIDFWRHRNTQLFLLPTIASDKKYAAQLCLKIHDNLRDFITTSFNIDERIYCDQIGIIRWLDGQWQMPHIDAVGDMERVCGSVIYLNSNYHGGLTFYPYYDTHHVPQIGTAFAHAPDVQHLHGVTQVLGATRFTISSTWCLNPRYNPYEKRLQQIREIASS